MEVHTLIFIRHVRCGNTGWSSGRCKGAKTWSSSRLAVNGSRISGTASRYGPADEGRLFWLTTSIAFIRGAGSISVPWLCLFTFVIGIGGAAAFSGSVKTGKYGGLLVSAGIGCQFLIHSRKLASCMRSDLMHELLLS